MGNKGPNLTEETARRISDMIITEKRFEPGQRIPSEYELANELGVSRLTVREAVKILIANNMLTIKRGVGTFVSEYTKNGLNPYGVFYTESRRQHIKESFETRRIIEPEIVMLASQRATKEDVDELYALGEKCKTSLLNGTGVDEMDRQFHIAIAKAAHNAILYRLMSSLEFAVEESRLAFYEDGKNEYDISVIKNHLEIVKFIEEGDGMGACIVMRHHLNKVLKYFKNDY